jgi:hypothetical protein
MSKAVTDLFDRVASRYDDVLPFFSESGKIFNWQCRMPRRSGNGSKHTGRGSLLTTSTRNAVRNFITN